MGVSKVLKKIGAVAIAVGPALITAGVEVKKFSKGSKEKEKRDS